jgi:hypothetical protein
MPLTIPQIEALRSSNPQLYESLRRLLTGVNAIGTTNKLSLDSAVTDGSDFARVAADALTVNQIDPTKSGVLMKGSVPPTWNGAFSYVSTTSSLTWSWSGLTIYRADGTTTAIPNGSVAITGLAAGTTYYFYPYWDDVAGVIGWVSGGVGSPANAQSAKTNTVAQQQALQGRIPLSQGAMVAATTAAGTGGGSGGGSGSCLREGMMVLCRERGTVPIESCRVGDHLLCPSGTGARTMRDGEERSWTRIARLEILPADTFIRLHFSNEEALDVTPHHMFTLADGSPMRAERLCLSDLLVGRFARLTLRRIEAVVESGRKVTVSCQPCHEFYAGRFAATVLTHNYTFSS